MPHDQPRCPICRNAGWHRSGSNRACTHCELVITADELPGGLRDDIAAALALAGRDGYAAAGWHLSALALRNAAWALGHHWRNGAWRPAPETGHGVVLGVIGRVSELPAIEALAATPSFDRIIAVLDGDEPPPPTALPQLRLAMHRLDGDFAAQRNRLQELAEQDRGPCWVLQLDTDERPTTSLLRALGWITAAADADGLRSIGLPRRNLVDGAMTALFPDIQYRLNRSDIRFENRVHERPAVAFMQTSLGLTACIEHRLDAARVRARSIAYEAMLPGAARLSDQHALSQPFHPDRQSFR